MDRWTLVREAVFSDGTEKTVERAMQVKLRLFIGVISRLVLSSAPNVAVIVMVHVGVDNVGYGSVMD